MTQISYRWILSSPTPTPKTMVLWNQTTKAPNLLHLLILHPRRADVLLGLNDPVPFTFGSSLQPLTANHERINHLQSNSVVPLRLLQSTNISIDRMNMNNNNPTNCREIHYIMLHVLATTANLSFHLLRLDDVVSAHCDGVLLKEAHVSKI